jgi:O-antigen ligase
MIERYIVPASDARPIVCGRSVVYARDGASSFSRGLGASVRAGRRLAFYAMLPVVGVVLAIATATGGAGLIEAVTILLVAGTISSCGEGGLRFAFYFFLIFNFGAFALTLGRLGLLPIIAPILTIGGLFAIINILILRPVASLLNRSWAVLAMCGLALVSAAWSVKPTGTVKDAMQLTFGILLVIALVGRLGCRQGLQLLIRAMALTCIASVAWALLFPYWGIHQPYDIGQTVHAGLWRGVFAHKISLGTFSGLTFSLLLFYGWRTFSNPFFYAVALAASITCIVAAGSATGLATTIFFVGLLFGTCHIATQRDRLRRSLLRLATISVLMIVMLIFSGLLDQFVVLLGRSSDLTGRVEYWQAIIDFVNSDGGLVGYGYGQYSHVGVAIKRAAGMYLGEAHNGFLEMVVAFGYPGALFVTGIHLYLLWQAAQLLVGLPARAVMIGVLPFSYIATLLVSSYAESIILEMRGIWTILLTMSVCIIVKLKAAQKKAVRPGRIVRDAVRLSPVAGRLDPGLGQGLFLPSGTAEPRRL